jgi:hypothetical protein
MGDVTRIDRDPTGVQRRCKDCSSSSTRPAPHPGPRCATHHRAKRRQRAQAVHERRVMKLYRGMGPGDYDRIWRLQGARCPGCGRTGQYTKRRFPLDHNHELDWPRGIPCPGCNDVLAHVRDDPEALERLAEYLRNPPAWLVIGPPPELKNP